MENKKLIRVAMIMGKWGVGGVESVVMNFYRQIDKSKIQFDFFCDEDSTDIPYGEIEKLGGKVIHIPSYNKIFSYQKVLKKNLKDNNYKIVHSNINALSVFPLMAAKKAGIPVRIAHNHSTSSNKEWKRNLVKNILKKFSKKYSTKYFACSELAGRYLFGDKTFDAGKVEVINNAIDLKKFDFNEELRSKQRKELGIEEDALVLGNVGRFVTVKNHEFIIDVFNEVYKKNEKAVLLLIGKGPLKEKMENKVKKLELEKVVKFLGQRNDVNELYQAMDVFLFPSLYEGLGMVLIEAQMSGLSCIASDKVPKDAKVTENVVFLGLDEKCSIWAEYILNKRNLRKSYNCEIAKQGYEIRDEVKRLENKYIEYSKSTKNRVLQCGMTDNLGGIETFLMNYYRNIDRDKIQFDFVNISSNKLCFQDEIEDLGGKIYDVDSYYKHPIKYIRQLKKIIRNENYSIVHCNMNSAVMIYPLIAAKIAGCKAIISHSHNASSDKGIIKELLHNINKNFIPLLANQYFACSEKAGEWFFGKKIRDGHKYKVIYNAINTEKFKFNYDTRKKIRNNFGIGENILVLGHVGRFNKQKNHKFLIEVFKEVKKNKEDAILLLIGIGPLENEVKKQVDDYGLKDSVLFLEQRMDIDEIYQGLDIFVLPSLYEGLPLVGVEAQAAGCNCILSDRITKEVKCSGKTKFIPLETLEWNNSILEIASLLKHKEDLRSLDISDKFKIQNASKKLMNIYEELSRKGK